MFGSKKKIDFGVIIGEQFGDFLSFDEYVSHFLLPFSPRFRNIDFCVSSLVSVGVGNVAVFTARDKDIIQDYLSRGWPLLNFYVFDANDARTSFMDFFTQYAKEKPFEHMAVVSGSYPVWLNMATFRDVLEKSSSLAVRTKYERKEIYSCLVTDRKSFIKKYDRVVLDSFENGADLAGVASELGMKNMEIPGYVRPIGSLEDFYEVHIGMLENYRELDSFNAVVPIRGDLSMPISSNMGRDSHIINSIFGENVEVNGKVENSVIFSGVKVNKKAYVKNSLIFPGNHIGSDSVIINTIIDEYSRDNSNPNIEPGCKIGSESPKGRNKAFPKLLDFGVTLIGKDCTVPAKMSVGGNCYIESFHSSFTLRDYKSLPDGGSILQEK